MMTARMPGGPRPKGSARAWAAALALAFALPLAAGCGSTSLVNMWRDPQYMAAPLRNVFVVAVRKDAVHRRVWEDAFVEELSEHGVKGTPSYTVFADQMPDSEAVRAHLRDRNYDGLLITAREGQQEVTSYVPGYVTKEPVTVFRPMWGTYVTYYRDVYHPGYTETDSSVHVRTDLWVKGGGPDEGKLVWSGTSATIDPRSANQFSHSVAEHVTIELSKQHLIP